MDTTDLARRARAHAGAHTMLAYIVAETAATLSAEGEGHAIFVRDPKFTDDGVTAEMELHNPHQVKTARLVLNVVVQQSASTIDFTDDEGTIVFTVATSDDGVDTTALATLVRQVATLAVVVVRDEFADDAK